MFPKLVTREQSSRLISASARLKSEWSSELVELGPCGFGPDVPVDFSLSHWQCEPFYYALKAQPPEAEVRYFDRSGWTYRCETEVDDYRLFEFQRIECTWCGPPDSVHRVLDDLYRGLLSVPVLGSFENRVVDQVDEAESSGELAVRDIQIRLPDGRWVEAVGAHLHGRLFLERLGIDVPRDWQTACCGIGTSRVTNASLAPGGHADSRKWEPLASDGIVTDGRGPTNGST
jgi:hypothetical protein